MTEGRGDNGGRDESNEERRPGHPDPDLAGEPTTLSQFRRRINTFWGDSRTAELKRSFAEAADELASVPPTSALGLIHRDTLARLESRPDHAEFRLRKSLTLRDGELVAISGDESPLAADEDILAVTTTTTVMDSGSVAVETTVLVFEREG